MAVCAGLGCLLVVTTGCRQRELVRKAKIQQKEIQRLQTELDQAEAALKAGPPDRTLELPGLRERLAVLEKSASRGGPDLAGLETRKDALEKEALSYRARHPLKGN
ncbi:hypothetical protein [Luteolibacter sp. LG18]|uniref:hypothetical protein n=1 Tax=Luteolibacter sp. LG18 TaxID=2819286 RepID=UPI002B2B6CEE|nr:hypothetical protein llg_19110 [Luteolibacter sp. LG18]